MVETKLDKLSLDLLRNTQQRVEHPFSSRLKFHTNILYGDLLEVIQQTPIKDSRNLSTTEKKIFQKIYYSVYLSKKLDRQIESNANLDDIKQEIFGMTTSPQTPSTNLLQDIQELLDFTKEVKEILLKSESYQPKVIHDLLLARLPQEIENEQEKIQDSQQQLQVLQASPIETNQVEYTQILSDVTLLNQLTKETLCLVTTQQPNLDKISNSLESTKDHTTSGEVEIQEAAVYHQKTGVIKWTLLGGFVGFLIGGPVGAISAVHAGTSSIITYTILGSTSTGIGGALIANVLRRIGH